MKVKIAEKYRLTALILTVLLGFFNPVAQAFEVSGQHSAAPVAVQPKSVQIVEVVNSRATAKIVPASEEKPAAISAGCSEPQSGVNALIQGQTGINLNQPASCFRLAISQAASLPKISVVGLQKTNTRIVVQVLPSAFLTAFHLLPFKPFEESPAQIPYVAALLTILFLFSYRSFGGKNKTFGLLNPIINKFGLFVLRC